MNPMLDACLRSWPWDPWLLGGLTLTGAIYWRGWRSLQRRDPQRWHGGRLAAFLGGLATIFLALASPIEPFSYFLLQVHMLQHLLLMMAAPPLLWLGAPLFPLLRGLPTPLRVHWVAPWFRMPLLRRFFTGLTRPGPAWLLFVATTWFWHVPRFYELALRSNGWHYLQHACFLGSALLFWYPVVRPYPGRPTWSTWWLLPYLLLADVQNTVLSALLTFSSRVWYAHYAAAPRLGSMSALDDQAAAGVLMWVPGSVAFLVPLFWIGLRLLYAPEKPSQPVSARRIALPVLPPQKHAGPRISVPRSRFGLVWIRFVMLGLAVIIVIDGLRGPQVGAMNLAGVLPWIHWRGLVVLGLLAAGNVSCMACPLVLPRQLTRRWLPARFAWPRWLRNKWLAVGLIVFFLWAYEAFALWDSPWLTAWIVLAYFAVAFGIDNVFQGAAFCKYVCPIGQFNFVQSMISPFEIAVREPAVCAACATKDCIRGRDDMPGCQLRLYQPRKSSNLDCTFCLDCVNVCPHENVGLTASYPAAELWRDPQRSGIGRLGKRFDIAALVVILVFGAFVNAALMTAPVVTWRDRITEALGWQPLVITTLLCLAALVAAPFLVVGLAASCSRWWGRLPQGWIEVAARSVYALVPIGFAMWLTHYSFHFLTSYAAVIPTMQRFVADCGWPFLGSPAWSCACCIPAALWLLRLELVFLDVGLLLSLYTGYRIARTQTQNPRRAAGALAPWGVVIVVLFAAGIWIVFQPMQMRGTL